MRVFKLNWPQVHPTFIGVVSQAPVAVWRCRQGMQSVAGLAPQVFMLNESFDPQKLLSGLNRQQRGELMHALLAGNTPSQMPPLPGGELARAERWFWDLVLTATVPRHANARMRMWFIFMFLRYGAMRLVEVFSLGNADLDFKAGIAHVAGTHARLVPLPLPACRRMENAWKDWVSPLALERPLQCDASLVRRAFAQCAAACGIPPESMNASAIRRQRGFELAAAGLHPQLVAVFLGRSADYGIFLPQEGQNLIKKYIHREPAMKTSARNFFHGRITSLREQGILVEIILETNEGLQVAAVITRTSLKSLELVEGKMVNAIVKAPWVTVFSENARASSGMENCFQGKVEAVNRDSLACEILVALPQGNEICALYANGATPAADITPGARVFATFSAFAVILTED